MGVTIRRMASYSTDPRILQYCKIFQGRLCWRIDTNVLSSSESGSSIGTVVPAWMAIVRTPAMKMRNAVENTIVSLDRGPIVTCAAYYVTRFLDLCWACFQRLKFCFSCVISDRKKGIKKNNLSIVLNPVHCLMGFMPGQFNIDSMIYDRYTY